MKNYKFKEVVSIINGKNQKQVEDANGEYPIYGSGGIIGYANDFLCPENTVIIGRKGSINKPIFVNTKLWNVDTAFGLIPNRDILIPKFLYYFCVYFNFDKLNTTVTIPSLTKANILNIDIKIPSIEEQRKITARLNGLDNIISLKISQLSKLDQLVKSRFVEMFGECKTNPKNWKLLNMEDVADVGSSKRVFVEELQEEGIPFYRGTEVGALAERKSIVPELYITEKHYKELIKASGMPQPGDLLMPSICPDGRIWVVNTENPFYFKDGRVLWIHNIDTKFNSIFLLYTLKDRIMTDYLSIASGTTFAELKIFTLKKCKIFSVPLPLQEQFSAFVQQVDTTKSSIKQSLETLETLKKSLMQEYFG